MYPETILGSQARSLGDIAAFAKVLDELGPTGRLDTIRRLESHHMAALYEAAAGFRPVGVEAFVPADVPPMTRVRHFGKNSLPMFSIFEKHFAKAEADAPEVFGLNRQSTSIFTGPGYFLARPSPTEAGAVDIDYTAQPAKAPDGWPAVRPPRGIGFFVFGGLRDVVRGISEHVSIGRGYRRGKVMDQYFVLCRDVS